MFTKITQSLREQISRRVVIVPMIIAALSLCLCIPAMSVKTYVINDGAETFMHSSLKRDATSIVHSAGISLNELDQIEVSEDEKGNENITILRAGEVNIVADGQQKTVDVRYDDTVESALGRAGITVGELDEVSPAMNDTVEYGSTVSVARISVAQTTKTIEVPYSNETRKNASLNLGTTKVVQQGENGKKEQTIEVKKRDGVVVSETVVSEVMLAAPKNKIVEKGTKVVANVVGGAGTIATSRDGSLRYSKVIDVVATAYSSELISNKLTATGAVARVGLIAVDPKVIPLGTRMYITSADGKSWVYGYAVAADTGGAIKGNKIDLFFNTERECIKFGRRKAKVYILE